MRAPEGRALLFLFLVWLAGAGIRLQGVQRSLEHDEVFTWQEYASRSWGTILRSYTSPNNHIFHTLCLKFSVLVCGRGEWAVRLPALAAGALGIPAAFLLGRALCGSPAAGLLTAVLLALSPADGLLLLRYAKTAAEGGYASLYAAADGSLQALQMYTVPPCSWVTGAMARSTWCR